eukprot:g10674.t1
MEEPTEVGAASRPGVATAKGRRLSGRTRSRRAGAAESAKRPEEEEEEQEKKEEEPRAEEEEEEGKERVPWRAGTPCADCGKTFGTA